MATQASGPQEASVRYDGDSSTLHSPKKETQQNGQTAGGSEDAEENYWPEMRSRMAKQQGDGEQVVGGECPICYQQVDVLGRAGGGQDEDKEGEPRRSRECIVVRCGHIICRACAVDMKLGQAGVKNECPLCRLELRCRECGVPTLHLTAPSGRASPTEPGRASRLPGGRDDLLRVRFSPFDIVCPRCTGRYLWMKRITNGDLPSGADQIRPGFVQFVYHTAEYLETYRGQVVTHQAVVDAFKAMEAEFTSLMAQRDHYLKAAVDMMGDEPDATPWFEHTASFTSHGYRRGVV